MNLSNIKQHIFYVLSLLIFSAPVFAAEDFNYYVEKLSEHNQIKSTLAKKTENFELSVAAMGLPNITVGLGVDNIPIENPSFDTYLPSSKTLSIQQMIPSYASRKATSNVFTNQSNKQQIISDYNKNTLRAIFISSVSKLDSAKKQLRYASIQLKHYAALQNHLNGNLEAGRDIYWKLSQLDVDRSVIEQALNNLNAEKIDAESELIRLVGEVPTVNLPILSNTQWKTISDLYPVRIAYESVAVADAQVGVANAAYKPDYGIKLAYKQREDGDNFNGDDWISVQATFSVPLWASSNQKPNKRAALAKKMGAEYTYEDTSTKWLKRMNTLKAKQNAAIENIALYEDKTQKFKEMIHAIKRRYESGNTDLDSLLYAKINQLSIKSALVEHQHNYVALTAKINSYVIEE